MNWPRILAWPRPVDDKRLVRRISERFTVGQARRLQSRAPGVSSANVRASVIKAVGFGLGPLVDALGRAGVSEAYVLANAIGDSDLFKPMPDVVVGVLSPLAGESQGAGLANLDVMLRIGRSVERSIPTLLIVPPPIGQIAPSANVAVAYCDLDNSSALDFHLSALVASIGIQHDDRPIKVPDRDNQGLMDIATLLSTSPQLSLQEFENLVRTVLASGAHALLSDQPNSKDMGFDLVAVPDDAPDTVMLVQAKSGPLDEQILLRWEDALQHMVVINRARQGLLVYYNQNGREFGIRALTPLVVSAPLRALAERLASKSLAQVINEASAGAGYGAPT